MTPNRIRIDINHLTFRSNLSSYWLVNFNDLHAKKEFR